MRIPGTSFSDNTTPEREQAYNTLTEWSRYAIDVIKAQPHEINSDFYTVITLDLNPTDYKGEDDIKIEIWRDSRDGRPERNLVMMSNHHRKIATCIIDLNVQLDKIVERNNNPDIIELNGKKYRLTEIK